jgi:hypothetical protein
MQPKQRRYSKEESAKRGEEIFERDIRPQLQGANDTDFVLIDIETGDYEVDADEMAAGDRLEARRPNAHVFMRRVGSRFAYHFGGHRRPRPIS